MGGLSFVKFFEICSYSRYNAENSRIKVNEWQASHKDKTPFSLSEMGNVNFIFLLSKRRRDLLHNLTDTQLSRINILLRGTSRRGACVGTSPSSSLRSPVRIGDHLFIFQKKAGSRGKSVMGLYRCSHCGEERVFAVGWDERFLNERVKSEESEVI